MVALTSSDIAVKRRGKPATKDRTSDILLGGRARFDDRISIYRLTEEGIPLAAIVKFVSSVPMLKDEQVLAKIIGLSERTLHRRLKTPDEPLNPEQSARAVRFAQVLAKAREIFGSSEQAQDWMAKPVMALDGHKPVDLLTNPIGFELVDEFLTRLEYGVYQ
ncbi:MAG: antitoxin Xre/MbcA/ParS toxin-binding domain-containing protein [Pseudomonas sp.]|uniref:type II RES/Xre toxin-antitoxin system antitoxin n=1 Tax=unclassified Pseudomonas TaxID=196821 RepID=UPI000731617E|nr:antitoxin Xre/MbcA/ParS toxin-binding domain-containing protein [Pseudomonas sp. L5B5]KTC35643.1 toxin-antitoxin system antitoxin component [Pseudomonas sp. ABAC61]UCZ87625.1 DUF2384 domain-containing protein [Pseudomonas sp. L5B5]